MIVEKSEPQEGVIPPVSRRKIGSLRQKLSRSHFKIALFGIVFLVVALIVTFVLRAYAVRLAKLRGPTAQNSMSALSGTNRSLGGLRGWIVLGEPYFLDDLTRSWNEDIHPAMERLEELSHDWTNPENNKRLDELKIVLEDLESSQREAASIADSPSNQPAHLILDRKVQPVFDDILSSITALIDEEKKRQGEENRKPLFGIMADFRAALIVCRFRLENLVEHGSEIAIEKCCDRFEVSEEKLKSLVEQKKLLSETQLERLVRIQSKFVEYNRFRVQALEIRQSERWNLARFLLTSKCVPQARRATELLRAMSQNQAFLMKQDANRVTLLSNIAIVFSIALIAAMAVTSSIVSRRSAREIANPVTTLSNATRELAAGKRMKDIPIPDETELGQLTHSFNEMRKNLLLSEERFSRAIEDAPIPIVIHSKEGTVYRVNRTWEELTGRDMKDTKSIYEWIEKVSSNGESDFLSKIQNLNPEAERTNVGEFELLTEHGTHRVWDFSSATLGRTASGNEMIVSMATDITERKQVEKRLREAHEGLELRIRERTQELIQANEQLKASDRELRAAEAKYKLLLDNSVIHVAVVDRNGVYLAINNKAAELLAPGSSPSDIVGKSMRELLPEEQAGFYLERIERVCKTGHSDTTEAKYEIDGVEYWLWVSTQPIRNEGEEITGVHIVGQDITERKRLEEQARHHQEKLAHVSRLNTMGEMATGLAHELNQPLSAIAIYAAIGRRKIESFEISDDIEKIGEMLEKIESQSLRAGSIIHRLRRLVSRHRPEREEFDINESVRTIVALFSSETKLNDVAIELKLNDDIPKIYGDSIQIEQVILNLLRNAIEAMIETSGTVRELTIRSEISQDRNVELSVCDTGPRVTSEQLQHIFDPFVSQKENGMGMGLSISRTIIESHGGKLSVSANKKSGVTFHISLSANSEIPV